MAYIGGKLLVASRSLRDPNFARTVVLMIEHSDEGALGVVLNRPSRKTVDDVWESVGEPPLGNHDLVYLGGPVQGPLIAVHAAEELGEKEVLPGVFMSVERSVLEQLVQTPESQARLYSGHSGWGGGQLEGELRAGGWHVIDAVAGDAFTPPDENDLLWERVLNRLALGIMLPGIPTEELPPDPLWN